VPNANLQNFDSSLPTPGLPPNNNSGYYEEEEEGEYGQTLSGQFHRQESLEKTQGLPVGTVLSEGGEDFEDMLE